MPHHIKQIILFFTFLIQIVIGLHYAWSIFSCTHLEMVWLESGSNLCNAGKLQCTLTTYLNK